MPILYNFHILLATFYTIFGTNILIQCPMPVPVCCIFFACFLLCRISVPNGLQTQGNFLEIFSGPKDTYWAKEVLEGCSKGRTTHQGAPAPPPGPPVRRLLLFFGCKKAIFWRKIWAKVSVQPELRISIYIRNGERA